MTTPRRLLCALVLALPVALAGCNLARPLAYLFSPPQIQKAEFVLTSGRLALVLDSARPAQTNPVFEVNLHNRMVELFREHKVPSQVVPYDEVVALRQANPDFHEWSIQKIGRQLRADQVLYVRIEQLQLQEANSPVVSPQVELRMKVIGVQDPAVHARLWPDRDAEPDGRAVTHRRQPVEEGPLEVIDSETAKLARETAYYAARHFHRYDAEANPPHEP